MSSFSDRVEAADNSDRARMNEDTARKERLRAANTEAIAQFMAEVQRLGPHAVVTVPVTEATEVSRTRQVTHGTILKRRISESYTAIEQVETGTVAGWPLSSILTDPLSDKAKYLFYSREASAILTDGQLFVHHARIDDYTNYSFFSLPAITKTDLDTGLKVGRMLLESNDPETMTEVLVGAYRTLRERVKNLSR